VIGNYFRARTPNNVKGESAITWERLPNDTAGTTMYSGRNYAGAGGTYGFYWHASPLKSVMVGDIAEFSDVGFRFDRADPAIVGPYGEQNTVDIEIHDCNPLLFDQFTESLTTSVTWSGTLSTDRLVPTISRRFLRTKELRLVHTESEAVTILTGAVAPEGAITARPGSLYLRTNGSMYLKTSGTGNAGWTLK
jgi:hypothetical protein